MSARVMVPDGRLTTAPAGLLSTTITPARHRADTALIGMIIFMASWAMLFACLFFAYGAVRLRAPVWPPADLPPLPRLLPGLASVALALSAWAVARATPASSRGLALGAALGAAFLALQTHVWLNLWSQGLRPETGTYASVFYTLTVLHGLHVGLGIGALSVLATRVRRTLSETTLRSWTLYWHMVGVVWIVMYAAVYWL